MRRRRTLGLRGIEMARLSMRFGGTGHAKKGDVVWKETDGVVWKETDGVQMEDEEWEAKESFLSLERMG